MSSAAGVTVIDVQRLDSMVITPEFRSLVHNLAERLGAVHVVAEPRWQSFADRLHVPSSSSPASTSASLVVGSLASILKHAARATDEFGFVMPVAQHAKWWQRQVAWRDDATLAFWQVGWSPVAVDRVITASETATVEFVIGNARPTPEVVSD